jgi:hypothetical protein
MATVPLPDHHRIGLRPKDEAVSTLLAALDREAEAEEA